MRDFVHSAWLVTGGPCRFLRHPRYLGIIVFVAGIALVFHSWVGLILDVAIILVLVWRIRDEEALMHTEFGAEWEAYSRQTWRLAPFLFWSSSCIFSKIPVM